MLVHYCDHFEVPLPDKHRFPMQKYRLLRTRLLAERVVGPEQLVPARLAPLEAIRAVHAAEWVDAFVEGTLSRDAEKRLGFPWSDALVRRSLASVGGTCMAAEAALRDGASGNLAGGTHHAHHDFGSGYCAFNDIAVAARALLYRDAVRRVLAFDVDVHQGDGTATLFADDERVFTCSVHGAKNFPARKAVSDLDVALPDDTGDGPYLEAMRTALEQSLDAARPDIVFVQAGVDALAVDRLGRLGLTLAGMGERDRAIVTRLRAAGLPFVLTLGGGYAEPVDATLDAHVQTYRIALA